MSRGRALAVLVAALGLAAACAEDAPVADVPGARVRLWTQPHGVLHGPAVRADEAPPVLAEAFSDAPLPAPWRTVGDAEAVLTPAGDTLDVAPVPDGPGVRLRGTLGGLAAVVDVRPATTYAVSARIRTHALQPVEPAGFLGGTLFVAELTRGGPASEALADGLATVSGPRHFLPGSTGTSDGWVERRLVLRTAPDTRALLLGALLALPFPAAGGSVDFTDVVVRPVDPLALPRDVRTRAVADRTAGVLPPDAVGDDWRARTVVRARLRGESRPALALLPGEALEVALAVPRGQPVLELALGPFTRALEEGLPADSGTLVVRVGGREVVREAVAAPATSLAARWRPLTVDLSGRAGETTTLRFEVEGDLPLLVGSPVVRDASRRAPGANVLFVSIDTLRADHLSCYGYERETTPALDALARRSLLALDCTAQAPYTLPSHVTLFSGQAPSVHGVQAAGTTIGPARTPLLADLLAAEGLRTQAFTAGGYVNPVFGFDRGFDAYANVDPYRDDASRHVSNLLASDPDNFDRELFEEYDPERVLAWVEQHADERWFLFLHTYTVHDFDPPPGWTERFPVDVPPTRADFQPYFDYAYAIEHGIPPGDLENLLRHYDAALAYVDRELGRLFERLAELGLEDDTIVVVTSDHGKEIGERGAVTHGVTLYEELTRVPLIVHVPGREPRALSTPVMTLDVAPTVLAALGLPIDPRMQGVDLFGSVPERPVWSEVVQPLAHRYALRTPEGTKILHAPDEFETLFPAPAPWELYRLPTDPGEREDLAASSAEGADLHALQARLRAERARLEAAGEALGELGDGALDASTREQLEALGYFGHER